MKFGNQCIKCSIFQDTEAVIKNSDDKIKEATNAKERQYYAQDILLEAKALLSCPDYNERDADCLRCRYISQKYIQEYEFLTKDGRRNDILLVY